MPPVPPAGNAGTSCPLFTQLDNAFVLSFFPAGFTCCLHRLCLISQVSRPCPPLVSSLSEIFFPSESVPAVATPPTKAQSQIQCSWRQKGEVVSRTGKSRAWQQARVTLTSRRKMRCDWIFSYPLTCHS